MPDSTSTAVVCSDPETSKKSTRSLIDLGDITPHNLKLLKKVNQVWKKAREILKMPNTVGIKNPYLIAIQIKGICFIAKWFTI